MPRQTRFGGLLKMDDDAEDSGDSGDSNRLYR